MVRPRLEPGRGFRPAQCPPSAGATNVGCAIVVAPRVRSFARRGRSVTVSAPCLGIHTHMPKETQILGPLDPRHVQVLPKVAVGYPQPTRFRDGEGVRLDFGGSVHVGNPSAGPDLPSLFSLENVQEFVNDIQVDIHSWTIDEIGASHYDHIFRTLHHPKSGVADFWRRSHGRDVHPPGSIENMGPGILGGL